MKDLLKRLGIVEDDKPVESSAPKAAPSVTQSNATALQENDVPSVLDLAQIRTSLEDLIKMEFAFGTYLDYKEAVDSMESKIKDPQLRYQAAQAVKHMDSADIIESCQSYIGVLDREKQRFQDKYVASAQGQIDALKNDAEALDAQIQDLTRKLGELSQQKSEKMATISQRSSELAKAQIDFDSVINTIKLAYIDEVKRLQQYIGGENG
jgi:chromosome segregation ATPase